MLPRFLFSDMDTPDFYSFEVIMAKVAEDGKITQKEEKREAERHGGREGGGERGEENKEKA